MTKGKAARSGGFLLWVQDPHCCGKLVDIDQFIPEGGPGAILGILQGMGPEQLPDGVKEIIGSEVFHLGASLSVKFPVVVVIQGLVINGIGVGFVGCYGVPFIQDVAPDI